MLSVGVLREKCLLYANRVVILKRHEYSQISISPALLNGMRGYVVFVVNYCNPSARGDQFAGASLAEETKQPCALHYTTVSVSHLIMFTPVIYSLTETEIKTKIISKR